MLLQTFVIRFLCFHFFGVKQSLLHLTFQETSLLLPKLATHLHSNWGPFKIRIICLCIISCKIPFMFWVYISYHVYDLQNFLTSHRYLWNFLKLPFEVQETGCRKREGKGRITLWNNIIPMLIL